MAVYLPTLYTGMLGMDDLDLLNHLSKISTDPNYWGMGDFSINVGDNPCAQVPEPSILVLFAVGLFGLGFARRKVRS